MLAFWVFWLLFFTKKIWQFITPPVNHPPGTPPLHVAAGAAGRGSMSAAQRAESPSAGGATRCALALPLLLLLLPLLQSRILTTG